MTPVAWLANIGLLFSLLVTTSIVLITIGVGPFRIVNLTFALFALSVASWALFTLMLRLSLLFNVGNPMLFVQLVGLSFLLMGPLLLAFSVRYLNYQYKIADLAIIVGILAVIPLGFRLFSSALLTKATITPEGLIQVIFKPLGVISALIPIFFFAISLYLFWQSRKSAKNKTLAISIACLILGIIAGIANTPLPVTTILLTSSIAILGFSVISQQLFNPLQERTEALQHEIVERKQIEIALRASEQQYRSVVDHALQGIIITHHGQIVYANPTYCQMTGYSLEEIFSWTMDDYLKALHPDDLLRVSALLQERLQGGWGQQNYEFRFRHKNGDWLAVEAYDTPFQYQNFNAILTATLDITERKQTEEALRSSEKRYRSLFEAASDAIFLMEGDRFIDCNQRTLEVFGCTREQIIGESPYRFSPPQQPDGKNSQNSAQEKIAQALNGKSLTFEWKHCRLDGTQFDAEVSLNRVEINHHHCLLAIVRDIGDRKRVENQVKLQLERLRALHRIDIAISSSMDLNVILNVLLDQLISQLDVDAADVLLYNPHLRKLEYTAGRGFRQTRASRPSVRLGEGYGGQAALERRTIHVPALVSRDSIIQTGLFNNQEKFSSYIASPLIAKGQVKGVLEVFHREELQPDDQWLNFLEMLAGVAAIAIDNLGLFNDLQKSNMELTLAYDATIEGWSRALDLRDRETEGHTQRVTELTLQLAQRTGIPENEYIYIRWGALLHDIGKMGVPDQILLKPGPLTAAEWEIMQKHPMYALEMLQPISFLNKAIDIPYCHHERWDGTGYPRGLEGEQIPFSARLFSIVDMWDALGSNSPYRNAWHNEDIIDHIRSLSGSHFDPAVVDVFMEMIQLKSPILVDSITAYL